MDIIVKILTHLKLIYEKINNLTKRIENIESKLSELPKKEDTHEIPCYMCDGVGCSFCNDTGKITVVEEHEINDMED